MPDNTPITDIAGEGMSVNGDTLRTRIAAIVRAHNPGHLPDEGIDCNCGEGFRPESRGWLERAVEVERLWSQHVADAVIADCAPNGCFELCGRNRRANR